MLTMKDILLGQLTFETFNKQLNSQFRVLVDSANTTQIELIEALQSDSAANPPQEIFSLLFRGPASPKLSQRTYCFEHDELGRFDLFIVPVGQNQSGMLYQAVFNRLVKPD